MRTAIEALDVVLDENMNNHALEEQRRMAENYRNVGCGIMGMHDMLIKLGYVYGSEESKEYLDSLMDLMFRTAVIKSAELAKEKGAFPKYSSKVLESKIIRKHFTEDELVSLGIKDYGLRNCSLLSIAPSGSIGTMLNISTGCEPLFQISYRRKTESLKGEDTYYNVYTGVAKQYTDLYGENLPDYFITAGDINWRDRVDIQSVLQEHVDTAISSTINLPNEIKREEIEQLYLYAWEKGLKGVTIFRDGCKRSGILTTNDASNGEYINQKELYTLKRGDIISVDDDLISYKRTLKTGCGKIYLHLDFDEVTGEPYETWIDLGSGGGCERNLEFISRLISLCLRAGVPLSEIISQSESIRPCLAYTNRTKKYGDTAKGTSCPSAIGIALKELESKIQDRCFDEIVDEEEDDSEHRIIITNKKTCINNPCPECGEELLFEGGCNVCKNCGYSKCE